MAVALPFNFLLPRDIPGLDLDVPIPIRNQIPDPEVSWLAYDASLRLEVEDGTVDLLPLPRKAEDVKPKPATALEQQAFALPPTDDQPIVTQRAGPLVTQRARDAAKEFDDLPQTAPPNLRPYKPGTDDAPIIQTRTAPPIYVIFSGLALRAGFVIPIPALKSVGGIDAVPANRLDTEFVQMDIAANWYGCDIHRAVWRLRYRLAGIPSGLEVPRTPTK